MAHTAETHRTPFAERLVHRVSAFFRIVGTAMAVSAQGDARLRQVAALQAMTDAELAERGLTRDRIVHHVFRDIYYV